MKLKTKKIENFRGFENNIFKQLRIFLVNKFMEVNL